jgi:hypothetical protein
VMVIYLYFTYLLTLLYCFQVLGSPNQIVEDLNKKRRIPPKPIIRFRKALIVQARSLQFII